MIPPGRDIHKALRTALHHLDASAKWKHEVWWDHKKLRIRSRRIRRT